MDSNPEEIIRLYRRHATAWDADRSTELFEKTWLDRFLRLIPAGGSILDIGCGTGEPIARYVINQGFKLTGIDSSEEMLALCRQRFPRAVWVQGDMREMALGQTFDGLIAWNSFFHLSQDDQRQMFRRFAIHSSDSAALMFTSGPEEGEVTGQLRNEPLYHASLSNSEYQVHLEQYGFEVVRHINNDPECHGHTVWLAHLKR